MKDETHIDLIRIIFGILIPPLGVFLQVGLGIQLLYSIILTLFFWLPGQIYAVYVILKYNSDGSVTDFLS